MLITFESNFKLYYNIIQITLDKPNNLFLLLKTYIIFYLFAYKKPFLLFTNKIHNKFYILMKNKVICVKSKILIFNFNFLYFSFDIYNISPILKIGNITENTINPIIIPIKIIESGSNIFKIHFIFSLTFS